MDFQERFATEAACLDFLAASRWPDGFACPACGGRRAWVLERRHLWECSDCQLQTSVTAGTVMHGTRTPLRVWFWASYLVSTHQPGISAKQLQRQLGLSRYETAWLILQKLRRAMVAPATAQSAFFPRWRPPRWPSSRPPMKNSSISTSALSCLRSVEVRGRGSGRLRLATVPDASKQSLGAFAEATAAPGAIVHTDGWQAYGGLSALGYTHRRRSQMAEPGAQLLPRANRAVSNLKAWLHGTHRGVGDPHLQVYLDEFVFRHNRRRTPMAAFQTLLGLGAAQPPTTYAAITGHDQAAA